MCCSQLMGDSRAFQFTSMHQVLRLTALTGSSVQSRDRRRNSRRLGPMQPFSSPRIRCLDGKEQATDRAGERDARGI